MRLIKELERNAEVNIDLRKMHKSYQQQVKDLISFIQAQLNNIHNNNLSTLNEFALIANNAFTGRGSSSLTAYKNMSIISGTLNTKHGKQSKGLEDDSSELGMFFKAFEKKSHLETMKHNKNKKIVKDNFASFGKFRMFEL